LAPKPNDGFSDMNATPGHFLGGIVHRIELLFLFIAQIGKTSQAASGHLYGLNGRVPAAWRHRGGLAG